jgi:hypothetical protein
MTDCTVSIGGRDGETHTVAVKASTSLFDAVEYMRSPFALRFCILRRQE